MREESAALYRLPSEKDVVKEEILTFQKPDVQIQTPEPKLGVALTSQRHEATRREKETER